MSRIPPHRPGRRLRLMLAGLGAMVGLLLTGASGAFGYWLATSADNPSLAAADTLPTGATPIAAITPNPGNAGDASVTVTFDAVPTASGQVLIPAGDYLLARHPQAGGPGVTVAASCTGAGPITCVETSVPEGRWHYTDTPTYGENWVGTESATSNPVIVDRTAPSVPVPSVPPGYVTVLSVPVGLGTVTDAGSGVNAASVTVLRASAALSGGACAGFSPFAPATLTDGEDTGVLQGRCYQYQQRASDNVGNTTTSATSATVMVDTTGPSSPTLAFSGLAGAHWPGSGTTVFFRGGSTGGFTVTPTSTDAESGIAGYAYPSLGAGWSRSGGSYGFTGSAGTGTGAVTATNGAGSTATTTLTGRSDTAGPTGGALTVNGVPASAGGSTSYISAGSTLTLTARTDFSEAPSATQSGLASSTLTRRTAPLANDACGAFGSPTTITGTTTQSVATGTCNLLTLTGTDNVGNTSSITSTVKVDTTAPSTPTVSFSALGNVSVSGARVYFRSGAASGSLTMTATSTDAQSGIGAWTFPDVGTGWAVSGTAASRTYGWSTANPTTNSGSLTVTAANGAGLSSPASTPFTLVPDAAPPAGGALTVNGVAAATGGSSSYLTTGTTLVLAGRTDFTETQSVTQSGLASSTLTRQSAPLADNTCGTFGTPTTITGTTTQAGAPGTCYLFTLTGTDNVGNTASVSSTVKVDTTAPSTPTWAFDSLTNVHVIASRARIYYRASAPSGSLTLTATSTDPESGIAGYTFPSLGTGWPSTGIGASRTYTWSSADPTTTASTTLSSSATNGAGALSPASPYYRMVADVTAPTGGTLTVNGVAASPTGTSSYLTGTTLALSGRTDFVETVSNRRSGLAASTLTIQAAPLANDTCGTFGAPTTILGTTAQPVASGTCYLLTLTGADNVANTDQISSTVKVDASAPTISSAVLGNGGTASRIDRGDTLTVTFSESMRAARLCSAWTSDTTAYAINADNAVTVRVLNGTWPTNDRLVVQGASGCGTFDFGSLDLGSSAYVGGNVDFGGSGSNRSTISWDPGTSTLTITIGNGGPVVLTPPPAPAYTNGAATDLAGNAISNSPLAPVTGGL